MNSKRKLVGAFFKIRDIYIPYIVDYSQSIFSPLPRVIHSLYDIDPAQEAPATIHQMMWKALIAQYKKEERRNSDLYVDQTRGLVDIYTSNLYTIFIWKWADDNVDDLLIKTIDAFQLNEEQKMHICVYSLDAKTEKNNHIVWDQENFYINGRGEKVDD